MKTLVCTEPGSFEYKDEKKPALKSGFTLLKIKRVGICGTDLHAFDGTQPYFTYPRILGHEIAAEVEETSELSGFSKGDLVTISPYFNCGVCIACRNSKPNCCVNMRVCGVHVDGAMREYLEVPDTSIIKSEGLTLDQLALVEPLAIGAHGVRRAAVQNGEFVLVIGAGPIGLGTLEFARIAGATVIAMDINEQRLQFCRDKIGVPYTINSAAENTALKLKEITDGDMPTVIIDASGNLKAINDSFQYMAHGARFVLIGLQKAEIIFSHPEFHKREGTLMSSRNATKEDFNQVIHSLKEGLINPLTYITHKLSFAEVRDKFRGLTDPAQGMIKAMIEIIAADI